MFDCILVTKAKQNKDLIVNPIYKFTEVDIWRYIEENNIEVNSLYKKGFRRVGCLLCPLGGSASMKREAEMYPKYKQAYIRAFDRMIQARRKDGLEVRWKNGADVYEWWIGNKNNGQITIEDFLKGEI